jgi:hypothetical protein
MRLLSVVSIVILGAGCPSTTAPGGRVDRILVGDADTVVVYNREPIQLPVRTVGLPGRAVDTLRPHFVWLSADSIPLSKTGIIVCLRPGLTTLGVTLGSTFARAVVRCRPVRSVQMAGPLNLVVGDSLQPPLQVRVLGLDGQLMGGVAGKVIVSDPGIVKVEGSRVIPCPPAPRGCGLRWATKATRSSFTPTSQSQRLDAFRGRAPRSVFRARPPRMMVWYGSRCSSSSTALKTRSFRTREE